MDAAHEAAYEAAHESAHESAHAGGQGHAPPACSACGPEEPGEFGEAALDAAGAWFPPPPPSRTKWTRCVLHPVLIGHAASLGRFEGWTAREEAKGMGGAKWASTLAAAAAQGEDNWQDICAKVCRGPRAPRPPPPLPPVLIGHVSSIPPY